MENSELPWSQASDNNKAPILEVLQVYLRASTRVLEIGSGTGQHAVHFAPALPHLAWLPSDRAENHAGIRAWLARCPAPNLAAPIVLDVTATPWPVTGADAVFSANTAHIMHWSAVCAMLRGVAALLPRGGPLLLYGPFRYGERHTSAGNVAFDASLRATDPGMGIRDVAALEAVAAPLGLVFEADEAMPANNRTLIWRRA